MSFESSWTAHLTACPSCPSGDIEEGRQRLGPDLNAFLNI